MSVPRFLDKVYRFICQVKNYGSYLCSYLFTMFSRLLVPQSHFICSKTGQFAEQLSIDIRRTSSLTLVGSWMVFLI